MEGINLWELMLSAASSPSFPEYKRAELQAMILELSAKSHIAGQEFSIEAADEGWLIRIFSCHDGSREVLILIKKTGVVDLCVGHTVQCIKL